jgi:SAM-dependent methyltransferase
MKMDRSAIPKAWPPPIRPFETAGRMLRVALGLMRKRPIGKDLYALIYGNPAVRAVRFMNYGYLPLPEGFIPDPAWTAESAQAALYHLVLSEGAALLSRPPQRLLEVSCGRGGGTMYTQALLPETRLTVLDMQPDAVLAAREIANPARTEVLAGLGGALPFAPASFDMVISVEAMMNLGREAFMAESSRVLRPGGVLSVCGYQNCPTEELQDQLMRDAKTAGLEFHACQDISSNILAACRADEERREDALRRGPRIALSYMRNFAAMPGTPNYRLYAEGKRCYFTALFTQPRN